MMQRVQISLEPELYRRAKTRAADLGISYAEYIRRLVRNDLGDDAPQGDISAIFGLGNSGISDVSENVGRYVGEALWAEHRRTTGQD